MLRLKTRRKLDGWDVEVPESEPDGRGTSVKQRLGDSDKLWAATLIAIVLVAAFLYVSAKGEGKDQEKYAIEPASTLSGPYDDAAHKKFAADFVEKPSLMSRVIEARFVGPSKFRITVPGNVSADNIEYMSILAANKILHEFRTRPVVQVYVRAAASGKKSLAATARWEQDQYGFVVKFEEHGTRPL